MTTRTKWATSKGPSKIFHVSPTHIEFRDFEVFKPKEAEIKFVNTDNKSRKIKLIAPDCRYFKLEGPFFTGNSDSSNVAPGLDVRYKLTFTPEEKIDYYCELTCITETERFTIPVTGIGVRDFPEIISFENAPVKCTTEKVLYIQNLGECETSFQLKTTEPFSVHPLEASLKVHQGVQVIVSFTPSKIGKYSSMLQIEDINGVHQLKGTMLEGTATDIFVVLDHNTLTLPPTFITQISQRSIKLINKSDYKIRFEWKKFATLKDEINERNKEIALLPTDVKTVYQKNKREIESKKYLFEDPVFTIIPQCGEVCPNSEVLITVEFHPLHEEDYKITAYCDVSGREIRLPLELMGKGKGPEVYFSYSNLELGEVYINSLHEYEVLLENRGSIKADFELMTQSNSLFASKFKFIPSIGTVNPGESQIIKIEFNSDLIGKFSETFMWNIGGRKDRLLLSFSGKVVGPTFHFDVDHIDFGTVSYNFLNTQYVNLVNTSDINMNFKLRVPEDGSLLQREFDIIPASGTIEPHSQQKIKIEFLSNTIKKYKAHLVVDIDCVGTDLFALPITAQCIVPEVLLSSETINFGECFIGYPYTQTLDLGNNTNQPAKYEVILPSEEENVNVVCTVDAKNGIIPSKSTHKIKVTIVTKKIGNVYIPLYVRIVGSDEPPFAISVSAVSIGPIVFLETDKVDFGRVNVLQNHERILPIQNRSPIPAPYTTRFKSRNTMFKAEPSRGEIPPNSTLDLKILVNLDECMRFVDEITIDIENGSSLIAKLIAVGKGNTIIASMPMEVIDFKEQFSCRVCTQNFILYNKGRTNQTVQWMPIRRQRRKGDEEEELKVFKIIPDRITLTPKSSMQYRIEAYSTQTGSFSEHFICKATGKVQKTVFETELKCEFITPLITFSHDKMLFEYTYNIKRPPSIQTQPLTIKNISPLPLKFSVKVSGPFSVDKGEYKLECGESGIVNVMFDPAYRKDRISHEVNSKLLVVYKDHPQKDSIDLYCNIAFPNIEFKATTIDFGAVLNDHEARKSLTVVNPSRVSAYFQWMFDTTDDPNLQSQINQVFDILPLRGVLEANQTEQFEFVYYGQQNKSFKVNAICKVEGGPEYHILLKGESNNISYKLDRNEIDFGVVPFDAVEERDVTIMNTGKVTFTWQILFNKTKCKNLLDISPMRGTCKGGDKTKISVRFLPGIPDEIQDVFHVQVAHVDPEQVEFKAIAVSPTVLLSLPRGEDKEFTECITAAKECVDKLVSYTESIINKISPQDAMQKDKDKLKTKPSMTQIQVEAERMILKNYLSQNPIEFPVKRKVASRQGTQSVEPPLSTSRQGAHSSIDCIVGRYICDFGNVIKGMTKKKTFKVSNVGFLPATLVFDKRELAKFGIVIEPNELRKIPGYPENASYQFEVTLQTKNKRITTGLFSKTIPLVIWNAPKLEIEIRANIVVPDVEISHEEINFGTVFVGHVQIYTIELFNSKEIACEWIVEYPKNIPPEERKYFKFSKWKDTLQPGERQFVEVSFIPETKKNYLTNFIIKCQHNPKSKNLKCMGIADEIEIEFSPEKIEIGPVLPYSFTDTTFSIINKSNIDVELFSVDYDTKYQDEENILMNTEGYVDGYLQIPPRKIGEGLPKFILDAYEAKFKKEETEVQQGEKQEEEKPESPPPENLEPKEEVKEEISMGGEIEVFDETSRKILVIHGPPFVGKTTHAKILNEKYQMPIVNIDDLIDQYLSTEDEMAQHVKNAFEQGFLNEDLGVAVLKNKFADIKESFIIDGLTSKYFENAENTARCIIKAAGKSICYLALLIIDENTILIREASIREKETAISLEQNPVEEITEEEYDKLSPEEQKQYEEKLRIHRMHKNAHYKAVTAIKKAKKAREESNAIDLVAVLENYEQEMKEYREKKAEEEKQAKKQKKSNKKTPAPAPVSKLKEPKDILKIEEGDSPLIIRIKKFMAEYNKLVETFTKENLDEDVKEKKRPKSREKTKPVEPTVKRLFVFRLHHEESIEEITSKLMAELPFEEVKIEIPKVETPKEEVREIPPPYTRQLIPMPQPMKKNSKMERFKILQQVQLTEQEIQEMRAALKKKDQRKKRPQTPEISTKLVESTRWTIPANQSVTLIIRFVSTETGDYDAVLKFGTTTNTCRYKLNVRGLCYCPEISTFYRNIFTHRIKQRPEKQPVIKKYIVSEKVFEFGPLLLAKKKDGYNKNKENFIEYYEDFNITNTGMYEAEVSFALEVADDKTFILEPTKMKLEKDQTAVLTVFAFPTVVGVIKNSVVCTIKDNPIPFKFDIACIGAKPTVQVDNTKIDFGKLLFNKKTNTKLITIKNTSTIPIDWKMIGIENIPEEFKLSTTSGTLKPECTAEITVEFTATKPVVLEQRLSIRITDLQALTPPEDIPITIIAEAYDLLVNIDKEVDFGTVKVSEGGSKQISLHNTGKYDVLYKFEIPRSKQRYFTVTPSEGTLVANAKHPTLVNISFKTKKEIVLKGSDDLKCVFLETKTKEVLGSQAVNVKVKSVFSKYSISPKHGINFGPLNVGSEKSRTFEIRNNGSFPFVYTLFEYSKGFTKPEPEKEDKKGRTPQTKKSKKPVVEELTIGNFVLSPVSAEIQPNEAATITCVFKSVGNDLYSTVVGIDIAERNPNDHPNGITFDLQGESCVPGILTDEYESIFEEQQIVKSMELVSQDRSVFCTDEKIFSFGTIAAGTKTEEQLKITNPFKVPCNVEFSIKKRDLNDKSSSAFDVQPNKQFIPAREHRYVKLYFNPSSLSSYSAIFEAIVTDGHDPKTRELKIELRGEGSLPQVSIEKPTERDKDGNLILRFPRTLVGRRKQLPVVVSNEGILPSTIRFDFAYHNTDLVFPENAKEILLESKKSMLFYMHFEPSKSTTITTDLNMVCLDNRFEDTTIKVFAEGVLEDVTIEDLPDERDSELALGDCIVGMKKEVTFMLTNHVKEPYRFEWKTPPTITISPRVGHLHGGSSKDMTITFSSDEPCVSGKDDVLFCHLKKIRYTNQDVLSDWDDRHRKVKWQRVPKEEPKPIEPEEKKPDKKKKARSRSPTPKKQTRARSPSKPPSRPSSKSQSRPSSKSQSRPSSRTQSRPPSRTLEEPKSQEPQKPVEMVLKQIEVIDPEPEHEILSEEKPKELPATFVCDYAKYEVDIDLTKPLTFATTKMFETRKFNFNLTNIGKVQFSYSWIVQYIDSNEFDMDTPFKISPSNGFIKPGESINFIVEYSPLDVADHENKLVCRIPGLDKNQQTPILQVSGRSVCPIVHFELTPSDYITSGRRNSELPGPGGKFGALDINTKVIEIESCGIRIKNRKRFYILNPTNMSYEYRWERIKNENEYEDAKANVFNCINRVGVIHPGKKSEIIFEYTPNTLETTESFWNFIIESRNIKLPFLVVGHALEPEVFLDTARINFKTVLVGAKSKKTINLVNKEKIPFSFAFKQTSFTVGNEPTGKKILTVVPSNGTIGPEQSIPIHITFTPASEEGYNFNLICRVKKKPTVLTCNIKGEGFVVHERVSMESHDGSEMILAPSTPNYIDFGNVQINDKHMKKILITNHGTYNFDYSWYYSRNRYLSLEPQSGTVTKGEKAACHLYFNPTREIKLDKHKFVLRITNGASYVLYVSGIGTQPALKFSFLHYDFGPCFLYHRGMKINQKILTITNQDLKDISFEVLYENKPYLEVGASATVLKPGQYKDIPISFTPHELRQYKEEVVFEINGLYKIPVIITGEGTAARIDLVKPAHKLLNFGALRVDESSRKTIQVINKSKIPATMSIPQSTLDQLQKNFVSIYPRDTITLNPKEIIDIDIIFRPEARLQTFRNDLLIEVEGTKRVLSKITGACEGIEVKLETDVLTFGPVVEYTEVTKRIQLDNRGDIPAKFSWNPEQFKPDFTITPIEGIIQPNTECKFSITYHPKQKNKTAQYDNLECRIEGSKSLYLTLTGVCVSKPEEAIEVAFETAVRTKQTKKVVIENKTTMEWKLKPTFDNNNWSGPTMIEIPPNSKREYEITYAPLLMKKNNEPDKGTLFFPLPTGKAILYNLIGTTKEPLPAGELKQEIFAKEVTSLEVMVENWMDKAQRFNVKFEDFKITPPSYTKGVDYIDVPGLQKRKYKFTVFAYKEEEISGKLVFKDDKSGEYLYYHIKLVVKPPKPLSTIELESPVRSKAIHMLNIENPLSKNVIMKVVCDSSDIIVPSQLELAPDSQTKLVIEYLPLLVSPAETKEEKLYKLELSCPELGNYPHLLKLKALETGPEKNLHFSTSLGNSQTQTIRFIHYSRVDTTYTCELNSKNFSFADRNTIKASAASKNGDELSLDIVYEPSSLGSCKDTLIIKSPQGGEYLFYLFGYCITPRPQGPIEIQPNGSATVNFKNVFNVKKDFTVTVDHADFSIKQNVLSLAPKQRASIAVNYKPSNVMRPTHGKLVITSKDSPTLNWVYYLKGLHKM